MNFRTALVLVVTCIGFSAFHAQAIWAHHETQQVPISLLFGNLQQRLEQNTNSFVLTYDLARLHSMAYSTGLFSIAVRTMDNRPEFYHPWLDAGVPRSVLLPESAAARQNAYMHLTNAILLYKRAIMLLKQSTNAPYQWLVLPLELGHAWCLEQAGARREALGAYRKTLALAWQKEVTGEFSFSEWVQDKWNAVKSGNNPLRTHPRRGHIGAGVCFSEEIIGYILKLLDPKKDASEIADLKSKQQTLKTTSRAITPILVPLADGATLSELVDNEAKVTFDLDGSGHPRPWGWITPQAAWLVFDSTGKGEITSGLQMFGNVTFWIFWQDGYAALQSLDADDDGVLRGDELSGIALWHDRNCNGTSEPGEVRSVADWDITTIGCRAAIRPDGMPWCVDGVTFSNGRKRPSYDWIAEIRLPEAGKKFP